MPQLDKFLTVMVTNHAESILLIEGDVATLQKDGNARPITRQPLSQAQLIMLLKEIAPAPSVKELDGGTPATFRYANTDGDFMVKSALTGGRWHASIALYDGNGAAEEVAAEAPAEAPPLAPPPATAAARRASGAARKRAAEPEPVVAAPAASAPEAPAEVTSVEPRGIDLRLPTAETEEERVDAAMADINALLTMLVQKGASDLHLRCGEPPLVRMDGEMVRLPGLPAMDNASLELMIRAIMSGRNRQEYADKNDVDFAYEIEGVARFRCNALRERKGAAGVFRVIPAEVVTVEQLGLSPEVQNLCYLSKGLVLVTGPTGSGKSTTLCALVDLVNRMRTDHVITIEDPIEFVHKNKKCLITQRQVGVHTQSFRSALRAALREDPDIILVGELRDLETVSIAIETAETGHLVFGTLHTTTAPSTIDRVIDQFPADRQDQIRVMLSESLKGVICQVLAPKIGGGRVAAREILLSIPAVSNLIREGKTFQIPSVMQTSRKLGMTTLNDSLIDLVDQRLVESKEAYIKAQDKTGFANLLKGHGHDTSFIDGDDAGTKNGTPAAGSPKAPHARPAAAKR